MQPCSACGNLPGEITILLANGPHDVTPETLAAEKNYFGLQEGMRALAPIEIRYGDFTVRNEYGSAESFESLYVCPACGTYYAYDEEWSEDGPGNLSSQKFIQMKRLERAVAEAIVESDRAFGRKKPRRSATERRIAHSWPPGYLSVIRVVP